MHHAHSGTAAWLDAYRPAASERDDVATMRELLARDAGPISPFHRTHFAPGHFTASAFVVDPAFERLLLIFHGKLHRWLQPGGHFEPEDQDVVAACAREVSEECGLATEALECMRLQPSSVLFDVDIHEIPARKAEPTHLHLYLRVLFRARHDLVTAGSDAKDARWVPLDEVRLEETDASVMRAVKKLIALRGNLVDEAR